MQKYQALFKIWDKISTKSQLPKISILFSHLTTIIIYLITLRETENASRKEKNMFSYKMNLKKFPNKNTLSSEVTEVDV